METESMVTRSMSVVLFAVAIVYAAAAAGPRPGARTAELTESGLPPPGIRRPGNAGISSLARGAVRSSRRYTRHARKGQSRS